MSDGTSSGARVGLIVVAIAVVVLIAALAFGFLRVDQTKDAKLPQISVSGGQAPKFNVDAAKVDVGTTKTTIDVPKVETEKKSIELPTVSVDKPGH